MATFGGTLKRILQLQQQQQQQQFASPQMQGINPMALFQSLLPAIYGGGGLQSGAGSWLSGIFGSPGPGALGQPQVPGFGGGVYQLPRVPGGITANHLWDMGGMPGTVSGGTGTRGPQPSPFANLGAFSGPLGNGGGAITPSFGGKGFSNMLADLIRRAQSRQPIA